MSLVSVTTTSPMTSPLGATSQSMYDGVDNSISNTVKAILIIVIFVISSTGNSTVLYIICKHYQMRTVTNALVVSLSVSDLVATWLCMPFTVISLFMNRWPFGEVLCIINGFLSSLSCIASILMVTLISVDRLVSIMKAPGGTLTTKRTAVALFVVWFSATVFSLPWYLIETDGDTAIYKEGFNHCMYLFHVRSSKFGLAYTSVTVSMCFGLPSILMAYCFGAILLIIRTNDRQIRPASSQAQSLIFQSEMRTANTVLIIIAMVIVSWLPYLIFALLELCAEFNINATADSIALILSWAIRSMHPILYAIRNPNVLELLNIKQATGYRTKSFSNILPTVTPRLELEQNGNVVSEENVKPKFDWTIVKHSPLSPRALLCGTRKGSDQDSLQIAAENIRQSTSL